MTVATASPPKADRWARRYMASLEAPSSSSSPVTSSAFSHSNPPTSPSKSQGKLGFGVVPHSIARDLKTSNSSTNIAAAAASNRDGPIVQSPDGTLAKVYGTLLEPSESREQQWRCAGCQTAFARDATLYLAPSSSNQQRPSSSSSSTSATAAGGETFCKSCYEQRFALGQCPGCDGVVIGSTREHGTFVRTSGGQQIWHGKCWATCTHCLKRALKPSDNVEGIIDGLPTCMDCFDKGITKKPGAKAATQPKTNKDLVGDSRSKAKNPEMNAAIAEMNNKFGRAPAAAQAHTETVQQQTRGSFARPASPTKPRPLTAQFSGSSFDLAKYVPSSGSSGSIGSNHSSGSGGGDSGLIRSDSRGRSTAAFPHQRATKKEEQEPTCHRCGKGPFDDSDSGTTTTSSTVDRITTTTSTMLSLRNGTLFFHPACFQCVICHAPIVASSSNSSFTSLGEDRFAHHGCAPKPVATTVRPLRRVDENGGERRPSSSSHDHVTLQRTPKAKSHDSSPAPLLPSSYLGGASKTSSNSSSPNSSSHKEVPQSVNRRFQSTAGATPPTRSTLMSSRPAVHNASHGLESLAMASSSGGASGGNADRIRSPLARLGAMPTCGGCARSLTTLEAVPGPRGTSWHPKCLVCTAPLSSSTTTTNMSSAGRGRTATAPICGKRLDSAAKVDTEGRVRCRGCFDRENARHRV